MGVHSCEQCPLLHVCTVYDRAVRHINVIMLRGLMLGVIALVSIQT